MDKDTTEGDPEQGLGGFCNAGPGGLWNLSFGKTLDAYREEAGCFSMLSCFLGLLWTGDSICCWDNVPRALCSMPLPRKPAVLEQGEVNPNGPNAIVEELQGLLCQA